MWLRLALHSKTVDNLWILYSEIYKWFWADISKKKVFLSVFLFTLHYASVPSFSYCFSTWIYRDKTYSYKSCTWCNEILSRSVYTPPDRSSIKRCINCHLSQVLVWIRFTSNSNLTLCCATFVIFITINAETNEHHDKRTSNWSSCKFS